MVEDVYKTPKAELGTGYPPGQGEFYVVSTMKFTILYVATIGLYSIYWFYKNWNLFRLATGERVMPFLRALFNIFFAHSLADKINVKLIEKDVEHSWRPRDLASLYVLLTIVSAILDRLSWREIGSPYTDVASLLMLPFICLVLLRFQSAINASAEDPSGSTNSSLTGLNFLWIFLGMIWWLLVIIGLLDMFGLMVFDA